MPMFLLFIKLLIRTNVMQHISWFYIAVSVYVQTLTQHVQALKCLFYLKTVLRYS